MKLHRWLTRDAGFQIWFDESHLEAGSPVAARLAEQMSACRAWIVLASRNSVGSAWVIAERDQALHCATENPGFSLIALRTDDCALGQAWPAFSRFNWLDMTGGTLTNAIAREVIDRLDGRTWSGRQTGLRDVYVSRGWRPADRDFADAVCEGLCARRWLLRLIGDSADQTSFVPDRIREILSACGGHVVILPSRGSGGVATEHDYRYLIRELDISAELGIPALMLAESDTKLPDSLARFACRLTMDGDFHASWAIEPPDWLEKFLEELRAPLRRQHIFLAAEFNENLERITHLREFVEAVTGLPCHIGRDFEGQRLREQIVDGIASASVFVANLSSSNKSAPGVTGVNLNTCVEAGMALGASAVRVLSGKSPFPVFLMGQCAPNEKGRTSRLPFMFRDSQITWYSTESELLGHVRRLLLPYRRRVINYEFARPL
ncbi:MAG: toll/interleukin-1 receptor domain-containing protein [Candidatus Hydrogenedentes bacterium]|nr:toll/interleukin-1 receptor domain-containing protein [Candidatus Hydrogenedentota bacterium]